MQTSRTPLEKNFCCVGVPPEDILLEVLEKVILKKNELKKVQMAAEMIQDDIFHTCVVNTCKPMCSVCGKYKAEVKKVRQWIREYDETNDFSIKCKESLSIAFLDEEKRLDVVAGVKSMCRVTGRFKDPSEAMLKQKQNNAKALAKCVTLKETGARKEGNKSMWTQLSEALCADSRALSTYGSIVKWISQEQVDVLRTWATKKECERDEHGVIMNRPSFLFGALLPDVSSKWWCGGKEEEETENSIFSVNFGVCQENDRKGEASEAEDKKLQAELMKIQAEQLEITKQCTSVCRNGVDAPENKISKQEMETTAPKAKGKPVSETKNTKSEKTSARVKKISKTKQHTEFTQHFLDTKQLLTNCMKGAYVVPVSYTHLTLPTTPYV